MPYRIPIVASSSSIEGVFRVIEKYPEDISLDRCICLPTGDQELIAECGTALLDHSGTVDVERVVRCRSIDQFEDGDVVSISTKTGQIVTCYKEKSNSNSLYVTDLCNSHCLMCPQPPQEEDSVKIQYIEEIISALPQNAKEICVTGGEPTVIGDSLFRVLALLAKRCPDVSVHILSNARKFSKPEYAKKLIETGIKWISVGVPLYSALPIKHDYIVQVPGAFNEAVSGIMNLARHGIPIELRVVLNKQTLPDLKGLAEFIFHNMPFVCHVALMGMENMGYVKKNWDALWVSPEDYQKELFDAVRYLNLRQIRTSIYNLPLCLLDRRLWKFSVHSISDFKVSYAPQCAECCVKTECGGMFGRQIHTMNISPIVSI